MTLPVIIVRFTTKFHTHLSTALIFLFLSVNSSILLAQANEMEIIYTLDSGLPGSGLNVDRVGQKISILGDINGDGYDDWATLAGVEYESGTGYGSVHIFLGGTERRESETRADIVFYGNEEMMFGLGTWSAGDVNADGYDDFLVYGSWLDENIGELVPTHALYYGGNPFDTEADVLFRKLDIHPGTANHSSDAGDVNNDGFDDILLSVYTSIGSADTAHVYLFYGSERMDSDPDVVFTGPVLPPGPAGGAKKFSGATAAGDVNGDKYGDIIVSTYKGGELYLGGPDVDTDPDMLFDDFRGAGFGAGPIVADAGDVNNDGFDDVLMIANIGVSKAFICYGNSILDNTSDVVIPNWSSAKNVGLSASSAGDLNKDGFDDILLGTSTLWSIEQGQARVFYGAAEMDSIEDISIDGPQPWSVFGYVVAGGGDFNGDTYPDFLIGDIGNVATLDKHDEAGAILLFYGGESISDTADAVFSGIADSERFGSSIAHAGDVNNDGYPDLIVGAPNYWDAPYHYAGRAYLYYGAETFNNTPDLIFNTTTVYNGHQTFFGKDVGDAGDLNGDGYSDIFIAEQFEVSIFLGGAPMDSIADYVIKMQVNDYSFSAVGDVNDDGFDDILYGKAREGAAGTAYLLFGGENLFGGEYLIFEGKETGDYLGRNTSAAGDLNNDGFADFIIGAPGNNHFGPNSGAVMLFYGDSTISTTPDLLINGSYVGSLYSSQNINGGADLNNDGFDDLVIGNRFFSLTSASYEGQINIFYGGASMDNEPDVTFTGTAAGMRLGKKATLLYDLNNDGFDELLTNEGDLANENELTGIYYGSAQMDTIPDILLPYYVEYADYDAYNTPGQSILVVGNQLDNAAGKGMGRVTIYSGPVTNIIETEADALKPTMFMLHQNYPNPFNPVTAIGYRLSAFSEVDISIYNILGQKIVTLVSERQPTGIYEVMWDAGHMASGVYYYQITAGEYRDVKKMILIK